ncbi:MAG: hypothetical protein QM813_04095 [Verrucomicrobiota bacterium]
MAVVLGLVGCVGKVTETTPGSKPAYRDRVTNRYQKTVDQVFEATKQAVTSFGNVTRADTVPAATNQVRTVEGMINGREIYVRIEALAPKNTEAVVQVRTKTGGTDLRLAADVVRQIGVYLE